MQTIVGHTQYKYYGGIQLLLNEYIVAALPFQLQRAYKTEVVIFRNAQHYWERSFAALCSITTSSTYHP